MTNNAGKRLDVKIGIKAKIIIPNCPRSLQLDGGGSISTKALDDKTLENIAEQWRQEFLRKARED